MPNTDEITGVSGDGTQDDSVSTQPGANAPSTDTTGNSETTGQPAVDEEKEALRLENERLKGQARSVQKKYLEAVRKGTQVPTSPSNGQGEQDGTEVFNAAMELSEAKLRNRLESEVFPFYDGSHPDAKDLPTLPASEFARVRKNPWAFASRESLMHAMRTGDLQPALLDIEQAIADRVDEVGTPTTQPKSTPKGAGIKQVNPSPAPVGNQSQPQGQDLWTMPMDQLESLNSKAVQNLSA